MITANITEAPLTDRLPPHSIEAEMCCLASMMLSREVSGSVVQMLPDAEYFYLADHQILFEILKKLYDTNRPMDAVIVREELKKRALLEEIGGTEYLARVLASVPSPVNGAAYAKVVRDNALLRQLIDAAGQALNDAYNPHDDADHVLDAAEKRIFAIAEKKVGQQFAKLGPIAEQVFETLETAGHRGMETGFVDMDDMLNGLQPGELIIVAARPSMGKAQPLDSNVLTLDGFKPMGELRLGDRLASIDGLASEVVGVYPQGLRQVYRVTLADGRTAECCDEHLWRVRFRHWPTPKVLTTAKIMALLERKRFRNRLWIETFDGTYGTTTELPVDPYLLGALLGDGSLGGTSLRFSSASTEVLSRVRAKLDDGLTLTHAGAYDYRIRQTAGASQVGTQGVVANPVTAELRRMGLWNVDATEKFIPAAYLDAPRADRLALLTGLLDTDGWVESFGAIRFATSSLLLAKDIVRLVRSLGGSAAFHPKHTHYRHNGQKLRGHTAYVCNLQLPDAHALPLIANKRTRLQQNPRQRQRRLNIVSIIPSRVTETQCIAVSHPSHLYVTDDFVVTHNTAFAMNVVEYAAGNNQPIAVFSLEMSKQQLAQRLMCSRAQIDAHKVRRGMLSPSEFHLLARTVDEINRLPVWVDDTAGLTLLELRAKCRRMKMQHNIQCIMIDYLQLMDNPGPESRQQQISEISRGIKAIARELSVPVICLSQLNRSSEQRDGHRPRMSDLRESGSIEQDADVVMLLHREDYYRMSDPDFVPDNVAEVIIAKQRNGPTGTVKLTFDNRTTTFKNFAAPIDGI